MVLVGMFFSVLAMISLYNLACGISLGMHPFAVVLILVFLSGTRIHPSALWIFLTRGIPQLFVAIFIYNMATKILAQFSRGGSRYGAKKVSRAFSL